MQTPKIVPVHTSKDPNVPADAHAAIERVESRLAQLSLLVPLMERLERQHHLTQEDREKLAHYKNWALQLEGLLEQERQTHEGEQKRLKKEMADERLQFAALKQSLETELALHRQVHEAEHHRWQAELNAERAAHTQQLQQLQSTLSWRITAPLRAVMRLAKKLLGR